MMRGVVRDQDNAEKLGFAVVKLLAPEKIVTTDENGEFVTAGLCAGSYKLLIKHADCNDTVFEVTLLKSRRVVLKLPHSVNALTEVDVMDKRAELKRTQTVVAL